MSLSLVVREGIARSVWLLPAYILALAACCAAARSLVARVSPRIAKAKVFRLPLPVALDVLVFMTVPLLLTFVVEEGFSRVECAIGLKALIAFRRGRCTLMVGALLPCLVNPCLLMSDVTSYDGCA